MYQLRGLARIPIPWKSARPYSKKSPFSRCCCGNFSSPSPMLLRSTLIGLYYVYSLIVLREKYTAHSVGTWNEYKIKCSAQCSASTSSHPSHHHPNGRWSSAVYFTSSRDSHNSLHSFFVWSHSCSSLILRWKCICDKCWCWMRLWLTAGIFILFCLLLLTHVHCVYTFAALMR